MQLIGVWGPKRWAQWVGASRGQKRAQSQQNSSNGYPRNACQAAFEALFRLRRRSGDSADSLCAQIEVPKSVTVFSYDLSM